MANKCPECGSEVEEYWGEGGFTVLYQCTNLECNYREDVTIIEDVI